MAKPGASQAAHKRPYDTRDLFNTHLKRMCRAARDLLREPRFPPVTATYAGSIMKKVF